MLARERIAPRAAEIDRAAEFPWDVVELFRENELFGVMFDEEYGGVGASALMTLVVIEELSKVCATSGLIVAVQELGSLGIKLAGSEEQKRRFLPRLACGEWLAAYALTEPGSGSDSAAMRTTARRDGDEYVLDGGKRFITNAGVASLYVVFAKTDPQLGMPGSRRSWSRPTGRGSRWGGSSRRWVSRGRRRVSCTSTTAGCRPRICSVGRVRGSGSRCGCSTVRGPGSPRRGWGSRRARPITRVEYARSRETMGKPIGEHQLIAGMLAEMETKCETAGACCTRSAG